MQVLLTRSISGLKAADHLAAEELSKIKPGQEVRWSEWPTATLMTSLRSCFSRVAVLVLPAGVDQRLRDQAGPQSQAAAAVLVAFGNMPQDAWEDFFSPGYRVRLPADHSRDQRRRSPRSSGGDGRVGTKHKETTRA